MVTTSKRHHKTLLIISLSVNILAAGYYIGKRVYYSNVLYFYKNWGISLHPVRDSQKKWDDYMRAKPDMAGIIFSGTSITQNFQLYKQFHNHHLINLGFAWNKNWNLLKQAAIYSKRRPKKVFLEGGINDIRSGVPLDSIFNNLVRISITIKANSPATKIYIQSVLPTDVANFNNIIQEYNKRVESYCINNQITYLKVYNKFTYNNKINNTLTDDGVHPNAAGYFVLKNFIEPYITP